ncbi:unnamed protein product [Closterium sp. NIES-53]
MAPGQQASAVDMAVEGAEDVEEESLEAATSTEAAGVPDTAMTTRTTDAVADGQEGRGAGGGRGRGRGGRGGRGGGAASMKSAGNESESRDNRFPGQFFFVSTQAPAGPEKDEGFEEPAAVGKVTLHSLDYWVIDSGATYSMTPRADLLTELEPSLVKHVTSALGQRAEVKCMGKAMFKGADGKMVGLKNVLWVPNLAANLISVRRLQKAVMDTSSKGAKTYTARLGERILWDLHEDRDVYNEMWQILVVPMPKERQVAASISTKGEAVGRGDGASGRAKEIKSKKCNLGGTSKLSEHEKSGAAAQKQQKGEENPKATAEEEYGENMWGTIASAAFSNPTSATGECDWLTLHRRMGHVALPILQQLVKNEMVAGIRVKGEPDEVLGCPTCMEAKFTRYPFSSSEATAKAPLDEVVMDVVGPLKLGSAGAEYSLTIVDVYTRMTWVYVLSKKSDVAETVKTDWLPMVERQQDRLVKAIRTDRGGEFMSKEFSLLLKKNGIRHSLTMPYSPAMNSIAERANRTITETASGLLIDAGLPDYFWPDAVRSACVAKNRALTHVGADKWVPYMEWIGRKPKQNGIAEHRIGLVMEVACTSMIHAAAPLFLWPFVVRYAAHQLNLWPRVSLPETSPTLRWTGKVGDALVFWVWGSRAFVRDTSADKLSARAIPYVFLGFVPDAPGWQFYHPTSRRVLPSQDVTFEELVLFYRLFPYRYIPPPPPPLSSLLQVLLEVLRLEVLSLGVLSLGVLRLGGAEPGGAERGGAELGGPEPEGVEPGGAESEGAESGGAEPQGGASSGGAGAGGAGVTAGAGVPRCTIATGTGGARTRGTGAVGSGGVGGAGAGDPTEFGAAGAGGSSTGDAGSQPSLQPASPLPSPSPYTEQTGGLTEHREPAFCPASPVRTGRRAPRPCPPPIPGTYAMTLLHCCVYPCRPDYATALVAESVGASPPSVGGERALGTDVLEDRQEDFECLAAAVPRFASMLLTPEGDPDAPDIPTPRSYAEAITGAYSSNWQAAMDAEMASWKSTSTYVDEVPLAVANIVDGMWFFWVKRPPGSLPAFQARYVARGFSQRQGVDYF